MIPLTTDEERRIDQALGEIRRALSHEEKMRALYDLLQEERATLGYRVAAAVTSARTLRAALLRHVEQYGGGSHHRDDCPAPATCAECATNFMVEAALSSDTIAEKP